MAWTTPRTWVTGEVVTAAQMNTHVRDDLNYLYNGRERCRVTDPVQTITNDTETAIAFSAEGYDTATMHDNATNNTRITIPTNGVYLLNANGYFSGDADGYRKISILWNGVTEFAAAHTRPAGTELTPMSVTYVEFLSASQYVEMFVRHTGGANLDFNSAIFSAHRIG